jgi:hypothetical protein
MNGQHDPRHDGVLAMPVDQTYWPDGTARREPVKRTRIDYAQAGDRVRARKTIRWNGDVIASEGDEGTVTATRGPGWQGKAKIRWDWTLQWFPELTGWYEVGPFVANAAIWIIIDGVEARD